MSLIVSLIFLPKRRLLLRVVGYQLRMMKLVAAAFLESTNWLLRT